MAKEETPEDGSGLREVRITIVVEPGRVRTTLTKLLARAQVRAGLVSGGVIAAVVAGAMIAVVAGAMIAASSSSGHAGRRLDSDALATQFGHRSNCSRLEVLSPDGAYARIDLDHAGPCGTFGNQVTLIFHRVDGVWVREFEASSWRCPMRQLPQPVATELGLCGRAFGPSRPAARPPQGTL